MNKKYDICEMLIRYKGEDGDYKIITKIKEVNSLEEAITKLESYRFKRGGIYKNTICVIPDDDGWRVDIGISTLVDNDRIGVGWRILNHDANRKIGDTWTYQLPYDERVAWPEDGPYNHKRCEFFRWIHNPEWT